MNQLGNLIVRLLFDDKGFAEGLDTASRKTEQAAGTLKGMADTVSGTVVKGFVAGTAAVAAFAAASVAIGARFDREIRTVSAILGEGEEGFRLVETAARELGATTQFTATQAAEALTNLARAGFTAQESVAATGPSLQLATAASADLALATSSVAAALAQFQLGADQSSRAADVLANATTRTKFDLQGLTDAMKNAGPAGAGVGQSIEEAVAAVSQFRDLGLEASTSGIILRAVFTDLIRPSREAQQSIEALGLTLEDVDPTQVPFDKLLTRLRDAGATTKDFSTIFGRFGAQVQSVAQTVDDESKGFVALTTRLRTEVGRAGDIAKEIEGTVFNRILALGSATQEVFIANFRVIEESIRTVLEAVINVVQRIGERFRSEAGNIGDDAQDVADSIAEFLNGSADEIADTVIEAAEAVAEISRVIIVFAKVLRNASPQIRAFVSILIDTGPYLAAGAAIVGLGAKAVSLSQSFTLMLLKLQKFAAGIEGLPAIVGQAGSGLQGFAGAVTTSTVGLGAMALAVAAVIGGLIELKGRAEEAAEAQRLLRAESEASDRERNASLARQRELAPLLEAQREAALKLLSGTQQLTDAETRRAQQIAGLTTATLAQAEAAGKVVLLGDQISFVNDAFVEFGTEAKEVLDGVANDARNVAGEFGIAKQEIEKTVNDLSFNNAGAVATEATAEAAARGVERVLRDSTAAVEDLSGVLNRARARQAQDGITLVQAVQQEAAVVLNQLEERQEAAGRRAVAIEDNVAKELTRIREERALQEGRDLQGLNKTRNEAALAALQAGNQGLEDSIKQAINRVERVVEGADKARLSFLPKGEQIAAERDAALTQLDADLKIIQTRYVGNEQKKTELLRDGIAAREQLVLNAAQRLLDIEVDAQQEIADLQQQRNELGGGGQFSSAEGVGAIAGVTNELLAKLEENLAATREAIAERSSATLARIEDNGERLQAAQATQDELTRLEEEGADARQKINEEASQQRRSLELREVAASSGFVSQRVAALQELNEIQGVTYTNMEQFIDLANAAKEAADPFAAAFKRAFDGVGASLVQNLGATAMGAIVENVQALVGAIDALFSFAGGGTLLSAIQGIVADAQQLEASAEEAVGSARKSAKEVQAEEIADAQVAVEEAQAALEAAVAEGANQATTLPLFNGVVEARQQLRAALEGETEAIIAARDSLTSAVDEFKRVQEEAGTDAANNFIQGLLDFVESLLSNLDGIIIGLLTRIPELARAIIDGIVGEDGLLGQLDEIVGALIELLIIQWPILAFELVKAVYILIPIRLAQAAVSFVKSLFTEIIPGAVETAKQWAQDMLAQLPAGLVEAAKKFGQAIIDFVTGPFLDLARDIAELLSPIGLANRVVGEDGGGFVGDAVRGVSKLLGFGGGGTGAAGGMEMVQRTMRPLVHPGEAILTAAQNRERLVGPTTAPNPTAPIGRANMTSGPAAGAGRMDITLRIGDRDLDKVSVEASRTGGSNLTNKSNRRKTSTFVGYTRRTK